MTDIKYADPERTAYVVHTYPESLREELDETLARAREIRALTSRRFGDLGWTPSIA